MKNKTYMLKNGAEVSRDLCNKIMVNLKKLQQCEIEDVPSHICGIALQQLKFKAANSSHRISEQKAKKILQNLDLIKSNEEIAEDVQNIVLCAIQCEPYQAYPTVIDEIMYAGDHGLLDQDTNGA